MPPTTSGAPVIEEKDFQAKIIRCAELNGWTLIYHTYNSRRSRKGFPDLVMLHPEKKRIIFAELKTDTGKVTPEQAEWLLGLYLAEEEAPNAISVHLWRPSMAEHIASELGNKGAYLLR